MNEAAQVVVEIYFRYRNWPQVLAQLEKKGFVSFSARPNISKKRARRPHRRHFFSGFADQAALPRLLATTGVSVIKVTDTIARRAQA